MANQDTNTLVTKIKNCATGSFASAMFGKATDINADHDIDYLDSGIKDLLHIGYPTSTITDVYKNKHQYTFNFIAARLIEANDSDSDETKFANLEAKMWKILEEYVKDHFNHFVCYPMEIEIEDDVVYSWEDYWNILNRKDK